MGRARNLHPPPSRLAGIDYTADTVRTRLVDVGCVVDRDEPRAQEDRAEQFVVQPPTWRPDGTNDDHHGAGTASPERLSV